MLPAHRFFYFVVVTVFFSSDGFCCDNYSLVTLKKGHLKILHFKITLTSEHVSLSNK